MNPHFHIHDTIGVISWVVKEIKLLFKDQDNFIVCKQGFQDKKGNYEMIIEIHPLHEELFFKEYLPKMKEICKKNGITGAWESEIEELNNEKVVSIDDRIEQLALDMEKRYNETHLWKRGKIYADGLRNGADWMRTVMLQQKK